MNTFDGFFLPGFDSTAIREWNYIEAGELRIRFPQLTGAQTHELWRRLKHNRNRLTRVPVDRVVAAVSAATQELRASSHDAAKLLVAVTGYSEAVIRETLDHMFDDWSAQSLNTMLAAELGDARVLDQAVPDLRIANKATAAFGYPAAFHVFSGNVPGVAVTSLVRSLLVKSATLCKTASGEPVLPVLFARALDYVAPEIASCIAVTYWPREARETLRAAIEHADINVVYGGAEVVAAIRDEIPAGKRLVIHGPKVSFGVVGDRPDPDTAADVAAAVAAYDQQGCVSPHVVYVVGAKENARNFARDVAQALEQLAARLPRGVVSAEEAVAIRNARTAAEFSDNAEVFGSESAGYSIIFEDSIDFKVSCLNRVLYVKPVPAAADLLPHLPEPRYLQSAALEGFPEKQKAELARMLGFSGVSRITSFAQLPWPPMHWHHDGSAPLGELLWWQDIES